MAWTNPKYSNEEGIKPWEMFRISRMTESNNSKVNSNVFFPASWELKYFSNVAKFNLSAERVGPIPSCNSSENFNLSSSWGSYTLQKNRPRSQAKATQEW